MSHSPVGIVSAGLWLIDSTKYIDHYPAPSRLATVSEVIRSNGGGAFNVAINLSKLGATFPIHAIGSIGNDENGRWILRHCKEHALEVDQLRLHPELSTAFTDVMTEAGSGRRTFFYLPGANSAFDETCVDFTAAPGRIFYLGYPGLLPRLDRMVAGTPALNLLLEAARSRNYLVAVDFVSSESAAWDQYSSALPLVDVLFVNEWEACRLLNEPAAEESTFDANSLTVLAQRLLDRGVRRAVIVHAAQGAVCLEHNGRLARCGAVSVPENSVRGTCGAGDALAAGVLYGLHEGLPFEDALRLGVSAAATCLHDLTSSNAIRGWKDCLAYGVAQGYRSF